MFHLHSQIVTIGPLHIKSNRNQHVYYSSLGFGRNNHRPMMELNTNTSEYLAEAIHIMVCNQYKNKYIKLLERIETIK